MKIAKETKKTRLQKQLAEKMLSEDFDGKISSLCGSFNIEVDTFYKWLEEEDFRKILEGCVEKHNFGEITTVWKSLIDLCTKGNIQAIKFYFELKEKYGNSASPVTGNLIQIIDDIPKKERAGEGD